MLALRSFPRPVPVGACSCSSLPEARTRWPGATRFEDIMANMIWRRFLNKMAALAGHGRPAPGSSAPGDPRSRRRRDQRPGLERLEDRTMPAIDLIISGNQVLTFNGDV